MITFDPILNCFVSDKINDDRFLAGFGTTVLGDGRNIDAIYRFFERNNIPFSRVISLEQIHSVNVALYQNHDTQKWVKIENTDGIVTQEQKTALVVLTADCIPIVFVDSKTGAIGISHQGWRGSLKKMVIRMLQVFDEHGANKKTMNVVLGPSIGACCYHIDDDRYYTFLEEFDGYSERIFSVRGGKRYLNLMLLNYLLLVESGVPKERIDFFPFCTVCDSNRFFSFRRNPVSHNNFPRVFNFVIKLK